MDQYIGKFLDNRYEILEQIGTGGMAVVYKAKCHRLNRMVAVKILRENLMMDDEIRRRFHDEAQAVAMLSSSNIVSVYDVGQFEGADYIVMELIEGITLKEYMEKRGTQLSWREALHFMTQILLALKHAHSRGIIHRDIKPQNIMVLRDGSVKVADFGIAQIVDNQKTLTQEAFGSVHYVSPEQAKGIRVDTRSDIYSAGVVLYEMLTYRLPFDGDTPVSIALQHINSTPVPPRQINPEIPVGMEQICKKALCARLDLRYADAQAVLNDLELMRRDPEIVFPYADPWAGGQTAKGGAVASSRPAAKGEEATQAMPASGRLPERQTGAQHPVDPRRQTTEELENLEDQSRRKKGKAIFTGAVIAIVAVIIVLLFMLYRDFLSRILSPAEAHEVPTITNMTVDEAKETIAKDYGGFFEVVCSKAQYDDTVEAGRIIAQSPDGGSTAKGELTTIKVIISSGIQMESATYMPSLVRRDYRTAETMLKKDYGAEVKYADRVYSDSIPEGQVVSTDPVAGSVLEKGQTVTLYVSQGPENKALTMPMLIGLDKKQATEALEEAGLELGACVKVASGEANNQVIYQSVKAYSTVEPGTEVYIQVSDGSYSNGDQEQDEGDDQAPIQTPAMEEAAVTQPVYQITVPVTEDVLTSEMVAAAGSQQETPTEVTVMVTVNGEVILNMSCPVSDGQVSSVYKGEIKDLVVLINGVQTKTFDCQDISE